MRDTVSQAQRPAQPCSDGLDHNSFPQQGSDTPVPRLRVPQGDPPCCLAVAMGSPAGVGDSKTPPQELASSLAYRPQGFLSTHRLAAYSPRAWYACQPGYPTTAHSHTYPYPKKGQLCEIPKDSNSWGHSPRLHATFFTGPSGSHLPQQGRSSLTQTASDARRRDRTGGSPPSGALGGVRGCAVEGEKTGRGEEKEARRRR